MSDLYFVQTSPDSFFHAPSNLSQKLHLKYLTEQDIVNKLQLILYSLKDQQIKMKRLYEDKIESLSNALELKKNQITLLKHQNQNLKKQNTLLEQQKHKEQSLETTNINNFNSDSLFYRTLNKNVNFIQSKKVFCDTKPSQIFQKTINNFQGKNESSNESNSVNSRYNLNLSKNKLYNFLMPFQQSSINLKTLQKNQYIVHQNSFQLIEKIKKIPPNQSKDMYPPKKFKNKNKLDNEEQDKENKTFQDNY